jgi:hypothetical protein
MRALDWSANSSEGAERTQIYYQHVVDGSIKYFYRPLSLLVCSQEFFGDPEDRH